MCDNAEMKEYIDFRLEQEKEILLPSAFGDFETALDNKLKTLARYKEIADLYGGIEKVYVAEVSNTREQFSQNRIVVTATYPIHEPHLKGYATVEGHLDCTSLLELATVAQRLHMTRLVVIDRESKQILESSIY